MEVEFPRHPNGAVLKAPLFNSTVRENIEFSKVTQTGSVGSESQSDLITIQLAQRGLGLPRGVVFHFHVCLLMSFVNKSH